MTNSEQLTDKQIEQIRRDVAKAYHDLMIDLAMTGEGVCGNRRFWKDENNVIRWEDLPDDAGGSDSPDHAGRDAVPVPESHAAAKPGRGTRPQRNRRAAAIQGQAGNGKRVERKSGGESV